jgi:hypothetical protein
MEDFRRLFKDDAQPDESYETEAQWVGFWVAELDACLIGRSQNGTACLAYQAVPLTEAAINDRFSKEIAAAKKKWDCFERFLRDRGLVLEGSLNLVFDYD